MGLVPFWSKGIDTKYTMINAKSETAAKLPSFREPYRKRRCLIPATGYYEWHPENGKKQAYHISLESGLFAFAGLWDYWQGEDKEITSATIVTADATDGIKWIHNRMPIILKPEHYGEWLDTDETRPLFSLIDLPKLHYETVAVSNYVNIHKKSRAGMYQTDQWARGLNER